ncbi:MAG: hypothetical protein ACNI3A_10590 [Desulfovibrio sp.]|uniref:hypothetical protein n=1 Tax=Desulfovibrio sp. 7SRBS1 TaxID=3378064 RepID=UPI003B3D9785
MNSKIFSLGLSDRAITLYLLIDCMVSSGIAPTGKNCRRDWTGTNDEYLASYVELSKAGVVTVVDEQFSIIASSEWKRLFSE